MRTVSLRLLLLAGLLAGCARTKPTEPAWFDATPGTSKLIVTPADALLGQVVKVNPVARIAVLEFPLGRMPPKEHRLSVYRQGLKTGELKISGPQGDTYVVADILSGEVQSGDAVRDQ